MVKVLIVGATGFLGNMIAKEAIKKRHEVTALVSSESQSKKKELVQGLKDAGVQIVTGHLESPIDQLADLLKTHHTVRNTLMLPTAPHIFNIIIGYAWLRPSRRM